MTNPADSNGPPDPIDAVIADYLQKVEVGTPPDRDALLAAHPDLADRLRAFFADLDRMGAHGASFRLPELALPEDFGDYEFLDEIGRGGMGVVYRVRQKSLGREVALKMILSGPLADVSALRRFRDEAETVSRLDHPRIVPIYEIGEYRGLPYFTTKLIEGQSLTKCLDRYVGDPKAVAVLMFKVCGAIHHAHNRGVLHRDLKPGNILIDAADDPHVTDFGLARRLEEARTLTTTGAVLGTPEYMAPEQAAGVKDPTIAVDVYGLGAVLYALLTGQPPFRGETVYDTLRKVIENDPVPPSRVQPGTSRRIEAVCLKCLEKDPARRYRSVAELADDLQRYLVGKSVSARPPGELARLSRWAKRKPALAGLYAVACAAVVLVGVSAAVAWLWQDAEAAWANTRATLRDAILSLDGERGARAAAEEKQAKTASDLSEARTAIIKADQTIGALREGKAQADRTVVALTEAQKEAQKEIETGKAAAKKAVDDAIRERDKMAVAEYGRTVQLAHREWRAGNVRGALALLERTREDLRGWEWQYVRRLCRPEIFSAKYSGAVSFSPDGQRVFAVHSARAPEDEMVRVWDAWTGKSFSLRGGFSENLVGWAAMPWDRDGARIVTYAGQEAWVWNARSGVQLAALKGHTGEILSASLSPDGTRVVTFSSDKTGRVWDARTGTELVRLGGEFDYGVAQFSPDGKRLLGGYSSDKSLWDVATGKRIGALKGAHSGQWSSDGKRVVTWDGKQARVWDAETAAELPIPAPVGEGAGPHSFSPDGTRLLFARCVCDVRTGQPVAVFRGPYLGPQFSAWSPEGARAVTVDNDGTARIWNAWSGEQLAVLEGHTGHVRSASFSPDGKRVLTTGEDGTVRVWDARTGALLTVLLSELAQKFSEWRAFAQWSSEGDRILTTAAGTLQVWDVRPEVESIPLRVSIAPLDDRWEADKFAWSSDRKRVVTQTARSLGWITERELSSARVWDVESGTEVAVIEGVSGGVCSWNPDGTRLLGRTPSGLARVWDPNTGVAVLTLKGHADAVIATAYSPDGSKIVTTSHDKTVRIWDARTGAEIAVFRGHTGAVLWAGWSPDGSRIGTRGEDGTARLWEVPSAKPEGFVATGQQVAALNDKEEKVSAVSFAPDGKRLLTVGSDKVVRVWDARAGKLLSATGDHWDVVSSASWSPDGTRLATTCYDGAARVWDAATGKRLHLLNRSSKMFQAWWSPDGTRILLHDGVYDAKTGTRALALNRDPFNAAWSPDGKWILTVSWGSVVRLLDAKTGAEVYTRGGAVGAWAPNGLHVLSQHGARKTTVLSAKTAVEEYPLSGHSEEIRSIRWTPDGTQLLTQGYYERLWDVRRRAPRLVLPGGAVWSRDGSRYATGGDDSVRVWDLKTGALLATVKEPKARFALNANGSRLLTAAATTRVWDVRTGAELIAFKFKGEGVHWGDDDALSPDGKTLLTRSEDHVARFWDVGTGMPLPHTMRIGFPCRLEWSPDGTRVLHSQPGGAPFLFTPGTGDVTGFKNASLPAQFSPDGLRVVTASWDQSSSSAVVWDAQTGAELCVLSGHLGGVFAAVFSPDGKRIATASDDKTIRIWDARTGAELINFKEPVDPLRPRTWKHYPLSWSPDGSRLMILDQNGTAWIWDARVLGSSVLAPEPAPEPRAKP